MGNAKVKAAGFFFFSAKFEDDFLSTGRAVVSIARDAATFFFFLPPSQARRCDGGATSGSRPGTAVTWINDFDNTKRYPAGGR